MSEGITYDPLGTVTVQFDGNTYKLRRPTFGQFRYFNRAYHGIVVEMQAKLMEARELLEGEPTEESAERGREMIRELGEHPLHELTAPVLADMFTQVGDPLPDIVDDWPAWLVVDGSVIRQILDHWRTTPKVSGKGKEVPASG